MIKDKDIWKAFEELVQKLSVPPKPSSAAPKDDTIRINLSNRRGSTFLKLAGCAFEILLTGKTTIVVKKK